MWAKWLLAGLASGRVTTTYPRHRERELPKYRVHSVPVMNRPCSDFGCAECAEACPTDAITIVQERGRDAVRLDAAACIACGRCVDRCPDGVFAWPEAIDRAEASRERLISTEEATTHDG